MKFNSLLAAWCLVSFTASAQVPQLLNFQGRVAVNGTNFDGTGLFKFSLVNSNGTTTFWSNDGTGSSGSEPANSVSLSVSAGFYSVLLGDATLSNMTVIPATVFTNSDVRIRTWFNDGVSGSQLLAPDQRIAAVGYAMMAASVADGSVTAAKLAQGAVGSAQLASNLVLSGTVTSTAFVGNGAGLTNVNATNVVGTVPGTFTWQIVSDTNQQAKPNAGYLTMNDTDQVTISLPLAPVLGDYVRVIGGGNGGWKINPNGGLFVLLPPNNNFTNAPWTPHETTRSWGAVASSADGSKLIAAGNGEQIYTSTDSGVTWTPRETNRVWLAVASSADGVKLIAAVNGGQIYTSTDSGVTWTARETNRTWHGVASSADGTKLAACVWDANGSSPGQIYTSTDSGATWTPRESPRNWYSVASSADGTILVALDHGELSPGGQIYISADSGITWTPRETNRFWMRVASSADGRKFVAYAQAGQIYTSTDSGVSWTPRETNRDWSDVASSADGTQLVAVGYNQPIFISTDSGATWSLRESSRTWSAVASSADGTKLVAAVSGGQIYTSTSVILSAIAGGKSTGIELVYIGSGKWMSISSTGTIVPNY